MVQKVYACKNKNDAIRRQSTSGGVFTALAEYILAQRGVVYGAVFDGKWRVTYSRATEVTQLAAMRGSKYPQAYPGDTLRQLREDLCQQKPVLFVGTPCQVQGLKAFLSEEYENLICVDFICFGTASPGAWEAYLKQNFAGEEIRQIKFKDKRAGWHRFTTVIATDKREAASPGPQNLFLGSYLSRNNVRPSCYCCRFKGAQGRRSDLTISDSWGIERIEPAFDDDKGISNLFINSDRGATLFDKVRDRMEAVEIDYEKALQGNRYYSSSVIMPPEREKFWELYQTKGFDRAAQTVVKKLNGRAWLNKAKRIIKKMIEG